MREESRIHIRKRGLAKRSSYCKLLTMVGACFLLLSSSGCAKDVASKQAIIDENAREQEVTLTPTSNLEEDWKSPNVTIGIEQHQEIQTTVSKAEVTPKTSIEDEEKPEESNTLTLGMVGDILLHDRVNASGKQKDGTYNYDHLFANVKEQIEGYDIAIVNQEVILGGTELGLSGYPAFNGAFEVGDSLVKTGFDVVLHATNHALDKGKKGLLKCLDFWETNYPDIDILGIHDSIEKQEEIPIIEKNGIRVAILDYTYGTNGISLPEGMPYAVNLLDKKKVASDIKKAKECSDFILVTPHWGTEYLLTASSNQKWWADYFLTCGADLVIGTHPHVIEPVEWLKDKAGNQMLVFYSIGNFINATSGTGKGVANRMVGAIAEVTLTKQEDGEVVISEYGVEPLVSHLGETSKEITTYRLSDYSAKLAQNNKIRSQDATFSFSYCKELCETVFGDLYDASVENLHSVNQ